MDVDLRQQLELEQAVLAEQQAEDLARLATRVTTLAALLHLIGGAAELDRFRAQVEEQMRKADLEALCLTQPPRPC
jgi:hypothetical protein